MNEQELLNAITANLSDLKTELTPGEFFFELGMDGSSFIKEVEVLRTLRSNSFREKLREAGIDFLFYRNGKLEFVEVTHA
ncbi:hypothetical protein D9M71_740570 [compost metagenome]